MRISILVSVFLLVFFYGFTGLASSGISRSIIDDGVRRVETDLDRDGKIDRIEEFKNNQLISLTKISKVYEKRTFLKYTSPVSPIEIREIDLNDDKKIDRVEKIYRQLKYDLLITSVEQDTKFSGKFDHKWVKFTELTQKKDEVECASCLKGKSDLLSKLDSDINQIKVVLENDFYTTSWGQRIHQSCFKKWGEKYFIETIKKSMSTGLQCLDRLGKENQKTSPERANGALENLSALELLLETKSITIVCHEESYAWNGVAAHASVEPNEELKELGIKHPYISINANDPKSKRYPLQSERDTLASTVFHEQLHNLFIRHGDDIEYPYSCETCCFGKEEGIEKQLSCKVCAGTYSSSSDENYISDMIKWGKSAYQSDLSLKATINYLKEFPGKRFGIFAYASASSDVFSPIGAELGKILKLEFSNLSAQEQVFYQESQTYSGVKEFKPAEKFTKLVARVIYLIYFKQDKSSALSLIENQIDLVKNLIVKEKKSKGNETYIYSGIKNKLDRVLTDIFLEDYPENNSVTSDRAYKILVDTDLI